jgi:hypothetical protein
MRKSGHLWHRLGHLLLPGLGVSTFPGKIVQQKDSGACPLLGTCFWVGGSLRVRLRVYLEALYIEACGLTDKQ